MPVTIVLRSEKGSPLTIPEVDANFDNLRDAVDGLLTAGGSINFGPDTPAVGDQDKPWLKTDVTYKPIGWFVWNGAAWEPLPSAMAAGTTAQRPIAPTTGDQFFDTTLNIPLIFERGIWRLLGGAPGDTKFVSATDEAAALAKNPGWVIYLAAAGRTLAAVNGFHAVGTTTGSETVSLIEANMPAHTHTMPLRSRADGGDHNDTGSDTFVDSGAGLSTGSAGSGTPHDNMQPTLFLYCLIKE